MLDQIVAAVQKRLTRRKAKKPFSLLEKAVTDLPAPRLFSAALTPFPQQPIRIIAEIKRASPSAGPLKPDLKPNEIAQDYQRAGAAAISILTEKDYFCGRLADLKRVKKVVSIPLLQKDFILEPYQIYESRLAGADAVLLIVALHNQRSLTELLTLTHHLKMTGLVEVHDESELEIALSIGAQIIGINNRNLKTLKTDLQTSYRMLPLIPKDRLIVVESGLHNLSQILELKERGAHAFLIGEALLKTPDPAARLNQWLNSGYK